jgi:beta-phosphoglucomutase
MLPPSRSTAAVIFDMDGVIIDSMPYHFIAWYEALRKAGVQVRCIDIYLKEGEKWEITLQELLKKEGISPARVDIRKIFDDRRKIFRKYFKRFIFNGAEEFIESLKTDGYRLALVTGTNQREMQRILPISLQRQFEVIVTGDQVPRGKPYPDPYHLAAQLLEIPPENCLVIENAPYGIQAAKSAGMRCIAITTSLPKEYLNKADIIVDRLTDITLPIKVKNK